MSAKTKKESKKKNAPKLKKVSEVKKGVHLTTDEKIARANHLAGEIARVVIQELDVEKGLSFDSESLKDAKDGSAFSMAGYNADWIKSDEGIENLVMGKNLTYSKLTKDEKEELESNINPIPDFMIHFEEPKRVEKMQGYHRKNGVLINGKPVAKIMIKFNHIGKMGEEIEKGLLETPEEYKDDKNHPFGLALDTLFHEMVHHLCNSNGVHDCNTKNQYHNKNVQIVAEHIGLTGNFEKGKGYKTTGITQELLDLVKSNFDIKELKEVFNFEDSVKFDPRKNSQKKRFSWAMDLPSGEVGKSMTTKGNYHELIEYINTLIDPATNQSVEEMGILREGDLTS